MRRTRRAAGFPSQSNLDVRTWRVSDRGYGLAFAGVMLDIRRIESQNRRGKPTPKQSYPLLLDAFENLLEDASRDKT
jgi:hypothetical protein